MRVLRRSVSIGWGWMLVLAGCPAGSGTVPSAAQDVATAGDGGTSPGDDLARALPSTTATVVASGVATLAGVEAYELTGPTSDVKSFAILTSKGGVALSGTAVLGADDTGAVTVDYLAQNGTSATARVAVALDAQSSVMRGRLTLSALGRWLALRAIVATAADGGAPVGLRYLSLETAASGNYPGEGASLPLPEGDRLVMDLVLEGAWVADEGALGRWLEGAGLAQLARDGAAWGAWITVLEESWPQALADLTAAAAAKGDSGGLAKTPECAGLVATVGLGLFFSTLPECCISCKASLPPSSKLPPLGQLMLAKDCGCCALSQGVSIHAIAACLVALKYPTTYTNDTCLLRHPEHAPGSVWVANAEGTGCEAVCAAEICASDCAAMRPGSTGLCGNQQCVCHQSPDAYCSGQPGGDKYCGGGTLLTVDVATGASVEAYLCPKTTCGNGKKESCPKNPALAELCDSAVEPEVCAGSQGCNATCSACNQPCQCAPGQSASGCGEGQTCTPNCQCEGGPAACEFAFLSDPAWCDPKAAPSPCPSGSLCRLDVCRCSYCGDGYVSPGEACEADVAGASCPGEQACVKCQCQSNCGNLVVDPGETCDGSGEANCGAGYECQNCTCVQTSTQGFCGDLVVQAGEQCDGAGQATCAGGQLCKNCSCVQLPSCNYDGTCDGTIGETVESCPEDCAPKPSPCNGNWICEAGETYLCENDCCQFASTCASDADCPLSTTCYHCTCHANGPPCDPKAGDDQDCPNGLFCADQPCKTDWDCLSGESCAGGFCGTGGMSKCRCTDNNKTACSPEQCQPFGQTCVASGCCSFYPD